MPKTWNKKSERGVALLVALFALILIAAVGLGMIFSSNGEMSVNNSFRQNHLAYFAARSGLEEARDRMRYKSTDVTNPVALGISDLLPTNPIGQANSVLYINNVAGVDPTNFGNNTYFDDELCHDINNPGIIANSPGAFNIKCPHNANSIPSAAGWAVQMNAEPIAGGGKIPYAWTRINLKLQEGTNPWCVLGLGLPGGSAANCNPATGPDASADQICYDGTREFVLTDAMPLRDAPGGMGGLSLPSQLAMGMYFGGTSGHGASGHSSTTGTSTTTGTSSTGTSSTGTSGSGTSSTGTSSTGTSSTGTSSTGTSSTGTSTTGTSSTGTSSTGTSTTGTSTTGTSNTGTSTTGTSTTGTSTTGTSTTGTTGIIGGTSTTGLTSGTSTTGLTTGTSSTGTSTTGTSTTGTSSTGTSSTGTSSSGTGTGGGTGGTGGNGAACSGVFTPAPPPASVAATSCNNVNSQPVYTVTSLAITPAGARRMLQYEIARITVPPVPAAVTLAGPNPTFNPPHSANFGINGNDANSCAASGHAANNVPAIGTTTDAGSGSETPTQVASDAATNVAGTLTGPGVKTSNFTGAGCSTGDDVQNVINVSPSYNTIPGLNAVVQSVIGSADQVVTNGGAVTDWGSVANPKVIAITGDASVSSGAGILLVTGNMVASGNFSWTGTILVIGSGSITFNGGGGGVINGAVVVANIGNSNYATDPTNSANLLPQLGSPSFTFNGGGTNGINYDSCLTTQASAHAAYKVLARREIVY